MADVDFKVLIPRLNGFGKKALEAAAGSCVARTNYEVSVEHLLLALCDDENADTAHILKNYGIDAGRVKKAITAALDKMKTGNASRPVFSPILIDWIQAAWTISSAEFGLAEIRSGALFVALVNRANRFAGGDYVDLFEPINLQELRKNFGNIVGNSHESAAILGSSGRTGGKDATPGGKAGDGTALGQYCTNFTQRAREHKVDPVFGRDREIRQMIDILGRRRKNNPICVGDPGVGKTAVVEGLALRIVEGDVPPALRNVEVVGLDLALLQAGASVKGAFEERLKNVLEEVKSSPKPIVLFIDEAHTLIGAGGAAGTGDAGQLLKPALARGELRTVAATTWSEYKKYFEKDAALARRFQLVKLDEPTDEQAVTMLRGLRSHYEQAHDVIIRDDALVAAAQLGSRYIAGRQHPDKGIDLMDTSAARVKIALTTKPPTLQDTETRIAEIKRQVEALDRDKATGAPIDEVKVGELHAEIASLDDKRAQLQERWEREMAAANAVLELRKKLNIGPSSKPSKNGNAPANAEAGEAGEAGDGGDAAAADVAASGGGNESELRAELDKALAEMKAIQGDEPMVHIEVTPEVVARVVADWTGVPMGSMIRDEAASILAFSDNVKTRIKGQDHVVDIVAESVRAAKSGLKDPQQPMGVFLFVGPSGVGKTETALAVADLLFGGEKFMTTINMSEFQEKHTVSRLIGSPPGYVGYGEGGVLTEAVRQKPYSVVLLDEVEKADPEVMNLFYQVFDKGQLSDGEGREVDFKDTILFMTSNLSTDEIMHACQGSRPDVPALIAAIRPTLSAHFKPALVARMTIVPFFPIDADAMKDITRLKLAKLQGRLKTTHNMALVFGDDVVDAIADRCTEVETGARNIDHIIRGTLMPRISTEILTQMSTGDLPNTLTVAVDPTGSFSYEFSNR